MDTQTRAERRLFYLCWAAYFSSYISKYTFSSATPAILLTRFAGRGALGLVGTAFFVAYGLGQLVNGALGDRLRPARMIGLGLFCSGALTVLMGAVRSLPAMAAVWFLNGCALSLLWSPVIKIFSTAMRRESALRAGVDISTSIPAGSVLSYALAALLLALSGWRAAFAGAGALVLLMAGAWAVLWPRLRTVPPPEPGEAAAPRGAPPEAPSFRRLFSSCGLLPVSAAVMMNGILKDGVTLWVPSFISEYFGVGAVQSVLTTILLPVFNLGGVWAARRLQQRLHDELRVSGALFAAGLAALAAMAALGRTSALLSVPLLAVCTACALGINTMLVGVIPMRFRRFGRASTVTGWLNGCSYFASAVASYGISILSRKYGWTATLIGWIGVSLAGALLCFAAAGSGRLRAADPEN